MSEKLKGADKISQKPKSLSGEPNFPPPVDRRQMLRTSVATLATLALSGVGCKDKKEPAKAEKKTAPSESPEAAVFPKTEFKTGEWMPNVDIPTGLEYEETSQRAATEIKQYFDNILKSNPQARSQDAPDYPVQTIRTILLKINPGFQTIFENFKDEYDYIEYFNTLLKPQGIYLYVDLYTLRD